MEARILAPHVEGNGTVPLLEKRGVGQYWVRFSAWSLFRRSTSHDDRAKQTRRARWPNHWRRSVLTSGRYGVSRGNSRPRLLAEWVDITLAARERFGETFFKRSPAAYFTDNVKAAAVGRRTPPDWWLDVRKEEQRRVETNAIRSLGLFEDV